mgnify:CR=1 FL=1
MFEQTFKRFNDDKKMAMDMMAQQAHQMNMEMAAMVGPPQVSVSVPMAIDNMDLPNNNKPDQNIMLVDDDNVNNTNQLNTDVLNVNIKNPVKSDQKHSPTQTFIEKLKEVPIFYNPENDKNVEDNNQNSPIKLEFQKITSLTLDPLESEESEYSDDETEERTNELPSVTVDHSKKLENNNVTTVSPATQIQNSEKPSDSNLQKKINSSPIT